MTPLTQFAMNAAYPIVLIGLLLPGLSMAQTRPTTQPTSTSASVTRSTGTDSTITAVTSTTTASPAPRDPVSEGRRLQRLYDEYHSVSKKSTTTASGSVSTTTASRPTTPAPVPRTQPTTTETSSRPAATRPDAVESQLSRVRIGVRGGVTYPIYLENYAGLTLDPLVGFVGGLVLNIGAGKVSFQPELNYSRISFRTTSVGIPPAGSITLRRSSDRFEVPLLLKFATGSYAGSRFFVNVGPYGSYLASASTEGRNESLENVGGRFGFGAAAGLGALIKAGPGHVSAEIRGLYDLGNTNRGFVDSRVILSQATLGYLIPLGGR